MKSLYSIVFFLCIPFIISCGDTEVPPLSVGGSGVTLMQGAETPVELYRESYSWLHKLNVRIHDSLDRQPPNYFAATDLLERLIARLTTMRDLAIKPHSEDIQDYIEKYEGLKRASDRRAAGSSSIRKLKRYETEVKTKFHISKVQLKPFEQKPQPTKAKVEENTEKVEDSDKLPAPESDEDRPVVKTPEPITPSASEGKTELPKSSLWVYFKSWESVHKDLIAAYKDGKECGKHYDRVVSILQQMAKDAKTEDQKTTLTLCWKSYEGTHKKTKEFTVLPEGSTKEDVLNELKTVAGVVRNNFDPDE